MDVLQEDEIYGCLEEDTKVHLMEFSQALLM